MLSPSFPRDEGDGVYVPAKAGPRLVDRIEIIREGFDAALLASQSAVGVAAQAPPIPSSPSAKSVEAARPLANAYDAAAKLAADANDAAAALENLKHLLVRHLADPAQARLRRAAEPYPEIAPIPPSLSPSPPPMMSANVVPRVRMEPHLPAIPLHPADRERGHFDIHGFLAGFILSSAIGALLYIYLTAG